MKKVTHGPCEHDPHLLCDLMVTTLSMAEAVLGKNIQAPQCVHRSREWASFTDEKKLQGESASAYAARMAFTGFIFVVNETAKWSEQKAKLSGDAKRLPLINAVDPRRWVDADNDDMPRCLDRLLGLCDAYKKVLVRLASHTSFNIASCLPGYNVLDNDFKNLRCLESTHEYNMRMELAISLAGVCLAEANTTSYLDPGTEEIIASFIAAGRTGQSQQDALTLLARHEDRMVSTCTSSRKRRLEFERGFAVARSVITGTVITGTVITGTVIKGSKATAPTDVKRLREAKEAPPSPVQPACDDTLEDRLQFALVSKEEFALAKTHFGRITRDGEHKFANTHRMYSDWMYTVLCRCSLAGVKVSRIDDAYVQYAEMSISDLKAKVRHVERIKDYAVQGRERKLDYEYDTGEATERCLTHDAQIQEAANQRKRWRLDELETRNKFMRQEGLKEWTYEGLFRD